MELAFCLSWSVGQISHATDTSRCCSNWPLQSLCKQYPNLYIFLLYFNIFISDHGQINLKLRNVSEQTWRFPHYKWKRETKRKLKVVDHWAYSSHVAKTLLLCIQAWQGRNFKMLFSFKPFSWKAFESKNLPICCSWINESFSTFMDSRDIHS